MSGLGTMVIGGHRLPITSVGLRGGRIWITAYAIGPLPAVEEGQVTIFGSDGQGVFQGATDVSWPAIPRHSGLNIDYDLKVEGVDAGGPRSIRLT